MCILFRVKFIKKIFDKKRLHYNFSLITENRCVILKWNRLDEKKNMCDLKIWENLNLAIVWKVFSYLKGTVFRIIIDVRKANKFAEKPEIKLKWLIFHKNLESTQKFFQIMI